jgi:hypothetical protein
MEKSTLLQALTTFARQRPGLEYGNYGDPVAYRSELSSITKSLTHFTELCNAVALRDGITAENILHSAKHAFSGRLSIDENGEIDYCTGQYWPTEYRRAACAVLADALWSYWREAGEKPREAARKNLSRGIAKTYFN